MSSQRSDWRERLSVNPSRMEQELAIKLQDDRISYLTQVEIPVTTADLYFPLEPRPLLVFIDGRVHLGTTQMAKDEELRSLLREERIQNPRVILRRLFGQEKRQIVQRNPRQPRKNLGVANHAIACFMRILASLSYREACHCEPV